MFKSQKKEEPLVPVTRYVHESIRNPSFEERFEGYMYGYLLYFIPTGLLFLLVQNTFILTIGTAFLFISYVVFFRHIGKYLAIRRRYGITLYEYHKANQFPLNFYNLRENEHQKLREQERQDIKHIEEALNSIQYHSISFKKKSDENIEIKTEKAETTPKENDPYLSGEQNIYLDESDTNR